MSGQSLNSFLGFQFNFKLFITNIYQYNWFCILIMCPGILNWLFSSQTLFRFFLVLCFLIDNHIICEQSGFFLSLQSVWHLFIYLLVHFCFSSTYLLYSLFLTYCYSLALLHWLEPPLWFRIAVMVTARILSSFPIIRKKNSVFCN